MGDVHPDDPVRGRVIDDQGRCIHHDGKGDVLCFRFPDEDWEFWACRQCHDDALGVEPKRWATHDAKELAVQCGICRSILGVGFYLERQEAGVHECPHCHAPWDPAWASRRDQYVAF